MNEWIKQIVLKWRLLFIVLMCIPCMEAQAQSVALSVGVSPAGAATAHGGGLYSKGQFVVVSYTNADSRYWFDGWYENGEYVSGFDRFLFTVTKNTSLVAKFTKRSVPTPTFAPDGGAYAPGTSSVDVTVFCANAGATIRYTTDNSEPTETSATVASGGTVNVPIPGTLKAKAWAIGMDPSTTKSASYTVATVAKPTFSPDGGAQPGSSVSVTVYCATSGATIRSELSVRPRKRQ